MLAEPKYKLKWAEDPRNINWSKGILDCVFFVGDKFEFALVDCKKREHRSF